MQRVVNTYPATVWLNPTPEAHWGYTQSIRLISQIFEARMVPMTLDGIARGISHLK